MSETSTYGQFCPVSMAAEVICSRWTVVLLRELLAGSTRFNDLRRGLPTRRCTIQFLYPELSAPQRSYWLVVDGGTVDLCSFDPGYEVDLLVTSSLKTMTSIWMGLTRLQAEVDAGRVKLDGDPVVGRAMQQWLKLSPFSQIVRRVA